MKNYSNNELAMLKKLMLLRLEESYRKVNEFSIHICFFQNKNA